MPFLLDGFTGVFRHELGPGEQRLLPLGGFLVTAVAVDWGSRAARPVAVGVAAVAHDQLDARLDAVAVAVRLYDCRLDLDRLPAVVHQVLLGDGLGVPRLGEHRLHRLCFVLLLSADDLSRHRVVCPDVVTVGLYFVFGSLIFGPFLFLILLLLFIPVDGFFVSPPFEVWAALSGAITLMCVAGAAYERVRKDKEKDLIRRAKVKRAQNDLDS